jgi:hypothetical protein
MRTFCFLCFWLISLSLKAAVPTFESLEPTQFATNNFRVAYRAVHTNDSGIIYPALPNTLSLVTNENVYGTFSLPAKVTLLTLGTNYLDMSTNSTWLLNSPTNDAAQVILSLSAGAYQGQLAFITSQNGGNSFMLPDLSEQWDVPGAFVDLQGDWIGSTNRGIILQYTAPDWIEMDRFDPGSTNGPFPGTTINPTDGYLPYRSDSTTFLDSNIHRASANSTYIDSFAGGAGTVAIIFNAFATWNISMTGDWIQMSSNSVKGINLYPTADNGTNTFLLNALNTHTGGDIFAVQNNGTNKLSANALGAITIGSITKAQKTAMTPVNGMIVYQTDNTPGFRGYVNGTWFIFSMAADP